MANEITISASLAVAKGNVGSEALAVSALKANLAGVNFIKETQTIPTTAGGTAIALGGLGSVGWFMVKNLDVTNYVDIMTAVSGVAFARLLPGEICLLRLTPALTAPAALAHTASVAIEYHMAEV
jgi:hypothetical protein